MATKVVFITTTGASTYTIPSDFGSLVSIEAIGGGAGGRKAASSSTPGPGGGGGAYAKITSATLTPGASISVQVGPGGTVVTSGTSSYFGLGTGTGSGGSGLTLTITGITGNFYVGSTISGTGITAGTKIISIAGSTYTVDTSLSAVSGTVTGYLVFAAAGTVGTNTNAAGNGGPGGTVADSIGSTKFAGGNGGDSIVTVTFQDGGGGGGAAGPTGAGWNGGAATTGASALDSGGGGGGAGGGSGSAGSVGTGSLGGNGGNGPLGTGGGPGTSTNGTAGTAGTGGGGGGGHTGTGGTGGAGAMYNQWVQTSDGSNAGPGGGGGGYSNANGGAGGLYGGGGGGNFSTGTTGVGAQGIIVFTYNPAASRYSGYKFPILNSDGSASSTTVDFDDMFVSKELFLDAGLYSWGLNNFGQLGQGTTATYYSSPVQVGSLTNWKQVSNSNSISAGVKVDGTLWTWGRNSSTGGQLGLGNNTSVSSPNQVGSLNNWKQVVCGGFYMLAIKTDGSLWSWGNNGSGQLGLGNTTYYSSPVQVGNLNNWKSLSIGAASGTAYAGSMAIKTDGTLWGWGSNIWGNLGINSSGNYYSSPVQVGSLANWKQVATGGGSPGSFSWTLAIGISGTLWAWGSNSIGQLGINSSGNYYSNPIQVGTLTNWKQITGGGGSFPSFAGIKTDGTLWVWGNNAYGQLGQGFQSTTIYYSSPIQVGSLTNWKQVSVDAGSGQYMSAIKTDGTLWTWGINTYGSLGTNVAPTTYYSSPVQVGALTNWKQVTVSDYHGIAISSPDLP